MADEVAFVVMAGKSTASTKTKTTFSEDRQETERIISLPEKYILIRLHKDYFKYDTIKLVFKPQLL